MILLALFQVKALLLSWKIKKSFREIHLTISGSTIADSEFVANQIKQFEREQNVETSNPNNKATVYNLRIDKVVIDGEIRR